MGCTLPLGYMERWPSSKVRGSFRFPPKDLNVPGSFLPASARPLRMRRGVGQGGVS